MAAQSSLAKHDPARDAELAARPSLTLTRRFSAAPEKVYAAWADPQKLVQWFGPGSVEEGSVKADIDLRVGGRYRISFNAKGTYNEVGGVYREVVPNQRLVFSWAWHSTPERDSLVTISMKPEGSGTLLTFLHEQFADATARDQGPDAAETRLNRLLNMILESAVEALGFDAATISARHGTDLAKRHAAWSERLK